MVTFGLTRPVFCVNLGSSRDGLDLLDLAKNLGTKLVLARDQHGIRVLAKRAERPAGCLDLIGRDTMPCAKAIGAVADERRFEFQALAEAVRSSHACNCKLAAA